MWTKTACQWWDVWFNSVPAIAFFYNVKCVNIPGVNVVLWWDEQEEPEQLQFTVTSTQGFVVRFEDPKNIQTTAVLSAMSLLLFPYILIRFQKWRCFNVYVQDCWQTLQIL